MERKRERRDNRVLADAEYLGFEGKLLGVGEFEARVIEYFESVVSIGIVRSGDHDARHVGAVFGVVSYAWRGEQAGEVRLYTARDQTGGNGFGEPGTGFAGVHAEQNLWFAGLAFGPGAESGTEGEGRWFVERGLARFAADAVCAEELSCHVLLLG